MRKIRKDVRKNIRRFGFWASIRLHFFISYFSFQTCTLLVYNSLEFSNNALGDLLRMYATCPCSESAMKCRQTSAVSMPQPQLCECPPIRAYFLDVVSVLIVFNLYLKGRRTFSDDEAVPGCLAYVFIYVSSRDQILLISTFKQRSASIRTNNTKFKTNFSRKHNIIV